MLKNFFRSAIRTIARNKVFAAINFIGLISGLSLALLIAVYVRSEVSYDQFHVNAANLYRLKYVAPNGLELASTPPPIAPKLKEYFPEVEETARLYPRNVSVSLPESEQSFEESDVYFADSSIMKMFSFDFIRGSAQDALDKEFTVVITDRMATKYFGDKDPIGESLIFGGKHAFKVTGVVKEFPEESHIGFNMLVPYENMFDLESDATAKILRNNLDINFIISHSYTYVMLRPGEDPAKIDAGMGELIKKYALPQLQVGQVFSLMPLTDIHLNSTLLVEPRQTNSITNIFIFIGVGILTLLIACINYINLSTAQSLTRLKEIGIRKILGSLKSQLIIQFLAESFLFCAGAMLLSYFVLYSTIPLLNEVTNKDLSFSTAVDPLLIAFSVALVVLITLLAGGYPAYFVSGFNSINALKAQGLQQGNQFMRKLLVVVQLSVACMLLSGSILIVKQLDFLTERPLGFQRDHTINVSLFSNNLNGIFRQNDSTFWTKLDAYRNVINTESKVKSTTLSSGAPGLGAIFRGTVPEGFTNEDNLFIANLSVDYDFLPTFGMELAAGRNFSREFPSDLEQGFIINETAVKEWNWGTAEESIGKTLNKEGKKGSVIGVVKDFNFTSLTTPVSAMVIDMNPDQFNNLSIRFVDQDAAASVELLTKEWNKLFPEKSFEYAFLDEQLSSQYDNFKNFGSIIKSFTLIAMLISCLGVYGLALFIVQRKVKEIGVRKVLGASVTQILKLIFNDFALLLLIGFAAAIPASYWLIDKWLQNFTYHTEIDVISYAVGLILTTLIVLLTIGYQAIKASIANPVNSLRSE